MLGVQGKATHSDSKMISSSEGDSLSHSKGPGPRLRGLEGEVAFTDFKAPVSTEEENYPI